MIKINLLPEKKKLLGPLQTEIITFSLIIILVVVLAGITSAFQKRRLNSVKDSISKLEKDLVGLSEISKKVESLERDKSILLKRMEVIRRLVTDRNVWPRFMDDISRRLPNEVWMTNFAQNNERNITINGFSFTNLSLAKFMKSLEKSPFIERVELEYAQKMIQGENDTVRFQLQLNLKQAM